MRNTSFAFAIIALCLFASEPSSAAAANADWSKVAAALGKSGSEKPGGIYRVGMPRSDLHVTLDGIAIKPALALGSWLAFAHTGGKTMAMGDLVLTEDEIGPVMKKLEEEHIDITALHNHLLWARPMTFYMHVFAEGDAVTLAKAFHDALVLSKTPLGAESEPAAAKIDLDTAEIDKALGAKGKIAGGTYQISIPRREPIKMHGMALPASMGTAEAINFQPVGKGKTATTGDFVLTAPEVNPVLRALRENGIEVTALHTHMLDESPRVFFMHFWAVAPLPEVLKGMNAALGDIDVKRS